MFAIFTGALRKVFAETIAALEAKSPWELSAGISTEKFGSSFCGSLPSCIALAKASLIRFSTSAMALFTKFMFIVLISLSFDVVIYF